MRRRGVYRLVVPNQRARTQRLVNFPASEEFITGLDEALPVMGYSNRSEFIRDAVAEKLRAMGIELPVGAELAPGRTKPAYARKSPTPPTPKKTQKPQQNTGARECTPVPSPVNSTPRGAEEREALERAIRQHSPFPISDESMRRILDSEEPNPVPPWTDGATRGRTGRGGSGAGGTSDRASSSSHQRPKPPGK